MKHKKARKLLTGLVSETLPDRTMKELEQHLKECEECRNEFMLLRKIISNIKLSPSIEQSQESFERTRLLVRKEFRKKIEIKRYETILVAIPIAFMSFTLFLISNIFVLDLISKAITPWNIIILVFSISYQFTGIFLLLLIFSIKTVHSFPHWASKNLREINESIKMGG